MERSSFFNSIANDREYQASDFAEFFNSLVTNGVFPSPATNLQVLSNSNMTVTLKAGPAWIKGYHYTNDSDLILPITTADGVLNRIDRIVIKLDTVARNITAVVKKGTFASSPVAPALQRDADAYELGVADIYVGAGVVSITQANITDQRMNTALCGWVNSLIQADTTAIFNQYQAWFTTQSGTYNTQMTASEAQFTADFTTWFNAMKGQLTTDAAGSLQTQINNINGVGGNVEKANQSALEDTNNTVSLKANQGALDTTNTNLTNHQALSTAHGAVATSTASTIALRDASGNLVAKQLKSDIAIGTAPLTVVSTTKVTNLNADMLDGIHLVGSGAGGIRGITVSTLDPSGGVDGDIWIKYI